MRSFVRAPGLLEQYVDDDIVVVDPESDVACALTGVAARLWAATDDSADADAWGTAVAGSDEDEVRSAVEELLDLGLLIDTGGVSRRGVLRVGGGLVATGGVMAIALPTAEAADSMIGAVTRTFTCTTPASATPQPAPVQTLNIGPSTTRRTVSFSVVSGGGAGGAIQTTTGATATTNQTINPGRGGNGGFVAGTMTLPAGAAVQLSVYVGCGGADTPVANNLFTSYSPVGHGGGGRSFSRSTGGNVVVFGSGGAGGGASAVALPGETIATLSPGAGGGAGNAAPSTQTAPDGGDGVGIGVGNPGAGTNFGSGGTLTAGGAAGSTTGSTTPTAATNGTAPAAAGGTGGEGGRVSATTNNRSVGASGGGGGGGYAGGGGGGATSTSTTVSSSGGGGAGSGYANGAAVGGSYTIGTITVTINAAGSQADGATYGGGGAPGTNPSTEINAGNPGLVTFSNTGGFTLT